MVRGKTRAAVRGMRTPWRAGNLASPVPLGTGDILPNVALTHSCGVARSRQAGREGHDAPLISGAVARMRAVRIVCAGMGYA